MLNKDQYNQDEYNDYYRQEIEGAEISGSGEESGVMSKIIIFLVLVALGIAGYFGYKTMGNTESEKVDTSLKVSVESSLPQSIQSEQTNKTTKNEPIEKEIEVETVVPKVIETITEKEEEIEIKTATVAPTLIKIEEAIEEEKITSVESTVTNQVQEAVANNTGKMSPDEVAKIVAAVMMQMNQDKTEESTPETVVVKEDAELIDALSDSNVDLVSADLIKELENIDISENTKIDNSNKKIDVYNKVNVQKVSGQDALSQLSAQINSVINEGAVHTTSKASNYTANITKEVEIRKNEMRIIVVRKGDTLGKIAQRAYGNVMDYKRIYRANPEVNRPDRIYVGQKLRIPN